MATEEIKRGAGRPRDTQYYLLSYTFIHAIMGLMQGDIAFACEVFPKRSELEHMTGGKAMTVTGIFKFPCKEDFDNYNKL